LTAITVLPNRVRTPSTTMKCWNAQKMIAGLTVVRSLAASI